MKLNVLCVTVSRQNMAQAMGIAVPNHFKLTGDTAKAWKMFKQRFELYLLATGSAGKSDEEKVALLLVIGGDELIDTYNSLEFTAPVAVQDDVNAVDQRKMLAQVI